MPKPENFHLLLSYGAEGSQWRAAYQKSTAIVSVFSSIPVESRENESASKYLLASHFRPILQEQQPSVSAAMNVKTTEVLAKQVSAKDLREMCRKMGLPIAGTAIQLAERITGKPIVPKNLEELMKMKDGKTFTRSFGRAFKG
jgi:hypothetical protein